ncbi:DUF1127 domain-containing protein [Falsiroseomonas sp. E2-1-a20]|uniref:DUF1127 domain-containing protein n=1 Tax=Falsiroseomonas sp. E2-1-a20 TaxID=3239300 RepID=UPI003F39081F
MQIDPTPGTRHRTALGGLIATWRRRRHGRMALAAMDPRLLRDIGLSPEAASTEALKPFWRA